jgi:hypothetical protein
MTSAASRQALSSVQFSEHSQGQFENYLQRGILLRFSFRYTRMAKGHYPGGKKINSKQSLEILMLS